jgi:hypothetical protein
MKELIEIPRLGAHFQIEKEECAELIDDLFSLASIWEHVRHVYRTTAAAVADHKREDFSQLENIQGQIQDHITHKILLSLERAYKNTIVNGTTIHYSPLASQE